MKKIVWILLFVLGFRPSSQDMIGWWNVDCGSNFPRIGPTFLLWVTDEYFTKFGFNERVSKHQPREEMNTLRVFNNQTLRNCYKLPTYARTLRYLIRAGFLYDNYDGRSSPPMFDLYIDNKKWSTVNTSMMQQPIYHEVLHMTHGSGSIQVCLKQTTEGEIPFISSLEAVPLWVNLYKELDTNATFVLLNRTNFGGNEVSFSGSFSEEKYNRIWAQSVTPYDYIEVVTLPDSTAIPANDPPESVLRSSIASINTSTPITLFVDLPLDQSPPRTAYLVLYFTEFASKKTRRMFDIYINDKKSHTVETEANKCKVVTLYPVIVESPRINITLRANVWSTLPPMISAMEVFTKIDHGLPYGNNYTSGTQNPFVSACFILIQVVLLVTALVHI